MAGRQKARAEPYGLCQGKGQPSVQMVDRKEKTPQNHPVFAPTPLEKEMVILLP